MCKGRQLTEKMREMIVPHLPERAFLHRDRGDGLFISNAPVFTEEKIAIPGFDVEDAGRLIRIRPDRSWAAAVEAYDPEEMFRGTTRVYFCRSVSRFRGDEPGSEAMALFCEGCKLIDAGESTSWEEKYAFDRKVRELSGIVLRGGCRGGGLYALAILDAWLGM